MSQEMTPFEQTEDPSGILDLLIDVTESHISHYNTRVNINHERPVGFPDDVVWPGEAVDGDAVARSQLVVALN